jgi:hypothetical protein
MNVYYDGYSHDFSHVADRRRFGGFINYNNLRIIDFSNINTADFIVITQSSDLSKWLKYDLGKAKLVFDFCDAYLLESTSLKTLVRGLFKYLFNQESYLYFSYKQLLIEIIKKSDVVVCASVLQKNSILPYCKEVVIIGDFHSQDISIQKSNYKISKEINILWEGLPENLKNLRKFQLLFNDMSSKYKLNFHIITNLKVPILRGIFNVSTMFYLKKYFSVNCNVFLYQWNVKMFSVIATSCDFAIIPIDKSDVFQASKPSNKLHLLWKMRIPVITSDTFSYSLSMNEANVDCSCQDFDEWREKITKIIEDEKFRIDISERGFRYVNLLHSEEIISNSWSKLFKLN